jgi:hypothetical protein
MNRGWGQAPRAPEAAAADLAKHHGQAPPGPHQTRLHAVGNQTRLTNYVETRAGQPPNLDKNHLRRCLVGHAFSYMTAHRRRGIGVSSV